MRAWTKRTRAPSRSASSRCASTACSTIVSSASSSRPATWAQSASGTSCPITAAIASGWRVFLAEPGDAAVDDLAQEATARRRGRVAERPTAVGCRSNLLLQRAEELGREEGIALGMLLQIGDETRFVRRRKAVASGDERAQGVGVEAAQIEPQPLRLAHQRRQLLGERVARVSSSTR